MAEVRSLAADLIGHVKIQCDSGLVCDGRKMKHGVGRASESHVYSLSIVESCLCHDVSWSDILLYQLHDLHSCRLGKSDPCRVWSRDSAVARKSHSDSLCEAVHGIGCVHAGAGSARRTSLLNISLNAVLIHRTCVVCSYCLKHVRQACASSVRQMSCEHRSACAEYRWDIHAGSRHQQARHILIAVRDHDEAVQLMGDRHSLSRVCNKISGNK